MDKRTLFEFNHMMVDLETLGTAASSVITEVGLLKFRLVPGIGVEIGDSAHFIIDTCTQADRYIDPHTLLWHLKDESRREHFVNTQLLEKKGVYEGVEKISVKELIHQLRIFCTEKKIEKVWAQSPSFDCKILMNVFQAHGLMLDCFGYNNQLDVRTIRSLLSDDDRRSASDKAKESFPGRYHTHSALSDCYYQVFLLDAFFHNGWSGM